MCVRSCLSVPGGTNTCKVIRRHLLRKRNTGLLYLLEKQNVPPVISFHFLMATYRLGIPSRNQRSLAFPNKLCGQKQSSIQTQEDTASTPFQNWHLPSKHLPYGILRRQDRICTMACIPHWMMLLSFITGVAVWDWASNFLSKPCLLIHSYYPRRIRKQLWHS